MRTCVCYLEIQRSRGKEVNARFANEVHLGFASVASGFHCGHWKAWTLESVVRSFFHFLKFVMNFLKGVVSVCHSFWSTGQPGLIPSLIFTLTFSILILFTAC